MEFVINNWTEISGAIVAAYGLAWTVARITPTPKDDAFMSRISRVFRVLFPGTK